MQNADIGLLLLVAAGIMNASFAVPMKFTSRWAWENIWLVWTFFALLLFPLLTMLYTIPDPVLVYRTCDLVHVGIVAVLGVGWGLSQVLFGVAVERIGVALSFSLVLGTSSAIGGLVPLLHFRPSKLHTAAGTAFLLGIGTVLVGVAICALAGRMRDSATVSMSCSERRSSTIGLILAILSGCGSALMNLGFFLGASIVNTAMLRGASVLNAGNAIWFPLLSAGAIPNVLYCGYLLKRNSSYRNFTRTTLHYWAIASSMAVLWLGSVLLYGISASMLGSFGPAVGWPLFMSLIVIAASLWGLVTGEWRGSGLLPVAIQMTGVAVLLTALFILARASQMLA